MNRYVKLGDHIQSVSKTHKFNKDKLVFLNTSDVLEGKILVNSYMSVSEMKGQAKKSIQNGDILYSEIRPKNRRYAYVKNIDNIEDYVVSTKLMVLRNQSDIIDTNYLYHFLTSEGAINYLQNRAENRIGSFPQITFEIIQSLNIWLPNFPTQQKIAAVLSALDDKIELNNKINAELEAMAKNLYDYWFVQFDFPNEEGKPYKSSGGKMVYNETLKREIPEGWELKKIGDLSTSLTRGISPAYVDSESDGIPVLNQKCIRDQAIKFGYQRRHNNELKNASNKFLEKYDVLVNSTGVGTLGRVALVRWLNEDKVTVDSHVTIVRTNNTIINQVFFGYSILTKQSEIENFANGSTGQVELNRNQLSDVNMIIPPSELQLKFSNYYSAIIDKTSINEQQNQELAQLRDWLLPMLMNGQVKVGDTYSSNEPQTNIAAEAAIAYQN